MPSDGVAHILSPWSHEPSPTFLIIDIDHNDPGLIGASTRYTPYKILVDLHVAASHSILAAVLEI